MPALCLRACEDIAALYGVVYPLGCTRLPTCVLLYSMLIMRGTKVFLLRKRKDKSSRVGVNVQLKVIKKAMLYDTQVACYKSLWL
jgi:hypothetical protein